MTEAPRPYIGVGVAIRKNGLLLLGQRTSAHGAGTWGFAGGHLEHGETPTDCALRETQEECGLKITPPWLGLVTNNVFPNGKHYITLMMIADWIAGEPQVLEPEKISLWQWFEGDKLPTPLFAPIESVRLNNINLATLSYPPSTLLI